MIKMTIFTIESYVVGLLESTRHYVNVSVLVKFSQKTSVFTIIIISSP